MSKPVFSIKELVSYSSIEYFISRGVRVMEKKERLFVLVFMIFLLGSWNPFVFAEDASVDVLKGLKSIYVQVDPVEPEIKHKDLTTHQLKADTERQLVNAGIEVLSDKEFTRLKRSRNYPLGRLDVNITLIKAENVDSNIYSIIVQVRQPAFLGRRPVVKIFGSTWERREMGQISNLSTLRERVKDLVNQFIDEYLSSNPKKK